MLVLKEFEDKTALCTKLQMPGENNPETPTTGNLEMTGTAFDQELIGQSTVLDARDKGKNQN